MSKINANGENYILGHSEEELKRLEKQARFYRDLTRNMLISAGITKGMRVVDFGAGAGDSSMLVAELVGDTGEVIAVDRSFEALERAKYRIAARGVKNVATLVGDEYRMAEVFQANKVDAAVGRLALIHQKDVSATFCKLVECVRPGGIVAFQEIDTGCYPWAKPALPLMSKAYGWMTQTFIASGAPSDMIIPLAKSFDQAGIQARHIAREGMVETGPDAMCYAFYADTIRTLLPVMQKFNVTTPEEVQVETLESRLRDEAVTHQAFFISIHMINAYGRMPA